MDWLKNSYYREKVGLVVVATLEIKDVKQNICYG